MILCYEILTELKTLGFSFPQFEHMLNHGMCYYYLGQEYTIGGFVWSGFTETDMSAAQEGCWLPGENDLLNWLQLVGFDISISWNARDQLYHLQATDRQNGYQYTHDSATILIHSLAYLIRKILKSKRRPYIPDEMPILEID